MQGTPMIIECDACKARFRLDRKLLQGHMGARFRCRRCGAPINVTTPESPITRDPASPRHRHGPEGPSIPLSAPPAPPRSDRRAAVRTSPSAASAQPLFEEESAADAKPSNLVDLQSLREAHSGRVPVNADNLFRISPIPKPPIPAAADISSVVRPKIEQATPHETPFPHPPTSEPANAIPAPPVLPIRTFPRLEDLVVCSPEKVVVSQNVPTRKPSRVRNIIVFGLPILLLAGGFLYFGTALSGQELLGKWFPQGGSASQARAAARSAYDFREMKSTTHEQTIAGHLFVVSGTVVNVGKETSRGMLQIRATLFGEDNQVLMENTSLAGNTISEPILRYMKRPSIEAFLKMDERMEGGENRQIQPGGSIPFMVVFFEPPGKIGSFKVHAADAD